MSKGDKEVSRNRRSVVMEHLLQACRSAFEQLEAAYPKASQSQYRLCDCLSVALSLFVFKFPSLSRYLGVIDASQSSLFEPLLRSRRRRTRDNIQHLFKLRRIPTDTTFRRRLDEVPTERFELVFEALFRLV